MNEPALNDLYDELSRATSYPLSQARLDRIPKLVDLAAGVTPAGATRDATVRAVRGLLLEATTKVDVSDARITGLSTDTSAWQQAYRLLLDLDATHAMGDSTAPERRLAAMKLLRGGVAGTASSLDRWVRDHERELLEPLARALLVAADATPSWIVRQAGYRYIIDEQGVLTKSVYTYELECVRVTDKFGTSHRSDHERGWLRLAPLPDGVSSESQAAETELPKFNTEINFVGLAANPGDVRRLAYSLAPDKPTVGDGIYAFVGHMTVMNMSVMVETARRPGKVWWYAGVKPDLDSSPAVVQEPDERFMVGVKDGVYGRSFTLPELGLYHGIRVRW